MIRPPRHPHAIRAPWARACALLLAVVVAVSQWAALAHTAQARHDQCAEHGEWVDRAGHAHPEDAAADESAGAAAAPRQQLKSEPVAASKHDHHHCDSLSIRRARAVETTGAIAALRPVTSSSPLSALIAAGPARPVPLLRLAPKNSPPA